MKDGISYLRELTHRDDAWWIATVQQLIQKHSSPSDDPDHDQTDAKAWVHELVTMIHESLPTALCRHEAYDENMRIAAITSQVLALWYCRVQRAKFLSPARPLDLRMKANTRWIEYAHAMLNNIIDERNDATYFPAQRWELPFTHESTSGKFI